jgi:hypothetical protein
MENIKKEFKLVFNSGVARRLLKMGVNIADIKADRANPDKTVFVFKNDEVFQKEFERLNKEIAEAKAAQEDDSE